MTPNNTAENTSSAAPAEPAECRGCLELDRAEAIARAERDASKVSDCRVLRVRHRAAQHREQS